MEVVPARERATLASSMITFLIILVVLAMLATLGVLFAGFIGLARDDGSADSARRSNSLMQWRVVLQGTALVLFVVLMLLLRAS